MGLFRRSRFSRDRAGRYRLNLDDDERGFLAALPDQFEALLEGEDGSDALVRLFPPAYATDPEREAEYRQLMRDDLVRRRVEALGVLRDTVRNDSLSEEELGAWMRVLNDVRLVLGTVLDVSEDSDVLDVDPDAEDAGQRVMYVVLSSMVDDAVGALAGGLPSPAGD